MTLVFKLLHGAQRFNSPHIYTVFYLNTERLTACMHITAPVVRQRVAL